MSVTATQNPHSQLPFAVPSLKEPATLIPMSRPVAAVNGPHMDIECVLSEQAIAAVLPGLYNSAIKKGEIGGVRIPEPYRRVPLTVPYDNSPLRFVQIATPPRIVFSADPRAVAIHIPEIWFEAFSRYSFPAKGINNSVSRIGLRALVPMDLAIAIDPLQADEPIEKAIRLRPLLDDMRIDFLRVNGNQGDAAAVLDENGNPVEDEELVSFLRVLLVGRLSQLIEDALPQEDGNPALEITIPREVSTELFCLQIVEETTDYADTMDLGSSRGKIAFGASKKGSGENIATCLDSILQYDNAVMISASTCQRMS